MFRYYTILGAKRVELVQLIQKFMPWCRIRIFRNEHTQSTPLDSCLCVSHSVWMHLAMFHYFTKLVAKRVELVHLMHKFVPWSHFGIFRNECTRPTPLDPKLMFWRVSYHLGAFGTIWLHYETLYKMGQTRAKVRATKSRRNFSQWTHPIHPIVPWTDVLGGVSYYLCAFGTVWLPYETRCKTDRTSAKVCAPMSRWNFSQRTHPIHHIGPRTDVLVRFVLFGCIRDRLVALRNLMQNGPN